MMIDNLWSTPCYKWTCIWMSAGANETLPFRAQVFFLSYCILLCFVLLFQLRSRWAHLDTVHVQQNVKSSHSKDSHAIIHTLQKHRLFFLKHHTIDLSGCALQPSSIYCSTVLPCIRNWWNLPCSELRDRDIEILILLYQSQSSSLTTIFLWLVKSGLISLSEH